MKYGQKLVERFVASLRRKETIAYIVVGTLTTVVNMSVYYILCYNFSLPNLLANAYSWVIAMLFAYETNKRYVFKPEKKKGFAEFLQITRFFSARFISFLVEETALMVFVDILLMNNMLIKGIMNVIVVIINYYFSKWIVFCEHRNITSRKFGKEKYGD